MPVVFALIAAEYKDKDLKDCATASSIEVPVLGTDWTPGDSVFTDKTVEFDSEVHL